MTKKKLKQQNLICKICLFLYRLRATVQTNFITDYSQNIFSKCSQLWHCGIAVITAAQLHSTKPELRFCVGSNPACGVSEIRDGEDLWQWSRLEVRLNVFCWSTIPQKQFIIIFIIISYIEQQWKPSNMIFKE